MTNRFIISFEVDITDVDQLFQSANLQSGAHNESSQQLKFADGTIDALACLKRLCDIDSNDPNMEWLSLRSISVTPNTPFSGLELKGQDHVDKD